MGNVTKEERKSHVILATSDSFVHNWINKLVGSDWFQAFVLDHLSKEESNKYWDKQIAFNGSYGHAKINFEEVHYICGGSMFLPLELYHNYVLGGIHPSRSFYVYQASLRMSPGNSIYWDPLRLQDTLLFTVNWNYTNEFILCYVLFSFPYEYGVTRRTDIYCEYTKGEFNKCIIQLCV